MLRKQNSFFPAEAYIKYADKDCVVYRMEFDDGYGHMVSREIMPGITLISNDFHTRRPLPHNARPGLIEINHCLKGAFECTMPGGRTLRLGPMDFSASDMGRPPADSFFPLGEYKGLSLVVDPEESKRELDAILGADTVRPAKLFERIFEKDSCIIIQPNRQIQHIFQELHEPPKHGETAYYRLKTAELTLFLEYCYNRPPQSRAAYFSKDVSERIREIEGRMTEDISNHISIKELARDFKMSETTLKKRFADMYGAPPYKYLKYKRMEKAAYLLDSTSLSITEIAAECGYQNTGKFSAAFASVYGLTPREYKKGVLLD